MAISGQVIPGRNTLVRRIGPALSRDARQRLRWMDYYDRHGQNARATCRHFGLSPDVFYRWRRRYDPRHLKTLEAHLRTRPKRVRQPQTPVAVVEGICALRETYPRWGKEKLVVLLQREGIRLSASTVGRVLRRLKARGLLREPRRPRLQRHVERAQRTYREEFYQVYDVDPELEEHRQQLQAWVHIYNTVRPHQHLNYLTPLEYCQRYTQSQRKG